MSVMLYDLQTCYEKDANGTTADKKIGNVRVSSIKEPSSKSVIDTKTLHSILLSVSGSKWHSACIGELRRVGPIAERDVCLVPANVCMKSAWQTSGHELHTVSLEFDERLFRTYCPELCSDKFVKGTLMSATYSQNQPLSSLVGLIARELDESQQMGELYSDGLFRLLAFELAAKSWSIPETAQPHGARTDKRVASALDYIEAHFCLSITVTDIASAAGMSPTHFIDRFRAQIGQTPYSYVIQRRLAAAAQLLRFSDQPIAYIAIDTGFANQQHLSRVMRARLGATPRTIRFGKSSGPATI